MADEKVVATPVTQESLEARLNAARLATIVAATKLASNEISGDTFDAAIKASQAETAVVKKALAEFETAAEASSRKASLAAFLETIGGVDVSEVPVGITARISRDEKTGALSDVTLAATITDAGALALYESIDTAIEASGMAGLGSVKGLRVYLSQAEDPVAEYTGKAAGKASGTIGGGGRGKGWIPASGGEPMKLEDVFQAEATAEQKAEVETIQASDDKNKGSKSWAIKDKVARDAGYTKAT